MVTHHLELEPMPILSALLLSVFVTAAGGDSASTAAADVRPLIDRVVTAYGGRSALEGVHAYRVDGHVVTAQGEKREAPTIRLFQRPIKLRFENRYSEGTELRILSCEHGWRGKGDSGADATGPMLDAMMLQAVRADLPWFLMQHAGEARVIESTTEEGRTMSVIEVPIERGLTIRAYVDSTSGRIAMSESRMPQGEQVMTFETLYSDYRKVGNVLFAFGEENSASGQPTGTITFDKVTLNPKVKAGDFGPPPGAKHSDKPTH